MESMFNKCKSLSFFPINVDWKLNYNVNINYMFYECQSLINIPDFSKFKFDINLYALSVT